MIFVGLGGANRDAEMIPDPQTCDVRRKNAAQHLAFIAGPHTCLGNNLARLETRIAFEKLLRHMPPLERNGAAVDAQRQQIETAQGRRIGYGQLVWATGGTARRLCLPGADLAGLFYLRSLADADHLKAEAAGAARICINGGGYIGLEAAAVFAAAGKAVTLVEAAPRLLSRVAGPDLSAFYHSEHRAKGVDIRLNTPVDALIGENGQITGIIVGAQMIDCDLVIAGIGLEPATGPILAVGATGGNGIQVDEHCRKSLPNVFAIGDCAAQITPFGGETPLRLASVQNAVDQAKTVAKALLGQAQPHRATPWSWSTQYDLRLQTVGLSLGYDQTVLRGDLARRCFSVIYLKAARVIALDCVNATKDYVQGRKLVEQGATLPAHQLADLSVPSKAAAI